MVSSEKGQWCSDEKTVWAVRFVSAVIVSRNFLFDLGQKSIDPERTIPSVMEPRWRAYIQLCLWTFLNAVTLIQGQNGAGLFDWFNFGQAGAKSPQGADAITDYASQSLGVLNYFSHLRRNPIGPPPPDKESNLLGVPGLKGAPPSFPTVPFLEGVPIVPGVAGSFPGVGACLPKGTPLVNPISPSVLQDFFRGIPGVQDVLKSFVKLPKVDPQKLMGKWYWVVSTPAIHSRYCATSEYGTLTGNKSFSIFDNFRDGAPHGPPKIGFGYGIVVDEEVSVYTQSDPCPYQVVSLGPIGPSNQYEYVILSNWAKYPVIGLAKDIDRFYSIHRPRLEETLKKEGFTNFFTDALGSVAISDWSFCKQKQNVGNIAADIVHGILFG